MSDFQIILIGHCAEEALCKLKMESLPVVEGRPLTSEPIAQVAGTDTAPVFSCRERPRCWGMHWVHECSAHVLPTRAVIRKDLDAGRSSLGGRDHLLPLVQ